MMQSLQDNIFVDQITSDMYTYDSVNRLFISLGERNHDMADDL